MDSYKLTDPDLIELLAAAEHERWAHWQSYVHQVSIANSDGSLTIPAEMVAKWHRQMHTTYSELSETEKKSDREQVLRYLPQLQAYLDKA